MRRLRVARTQSSTRRVLNAQWRPYSGNISTHPTVTASLFFHKNTAARRAGNIKLPCFSTEFRGRTFRIRVRLFYRTQVRKNNPNSCFYGVNSLSVDPRSAVGTETRETDVMWRSGAAGQLIKTRRLQFTVLILYWRKYSAPHTADTLQTLHYKLKSATAFKQVHLSALCSKMSVTCGCSYMHQCWRSILLLELCTNQLLYSSGCQHRGPVPPKGLQINLRGHHKKKKKFLFS